MGLNGILLVLDMACGFCW